MATENDELMDELDELDEFKQEEQEEEQNSEGAQEDEHQEEEEDYITTFLKGKGIEDKSKIKFVNEDETIEEKDWDSLSNAEKLNILQSQDPAPENPFDDAEIALINSIRQSGTSPAEYLNMVAQQSVNNYIQNAAQPHYTVDDYTDDELYIGDLINKTGASEEEAQQALEQAKSNEELYKKQIGALRTEYKQIEDENLQYQQYQQQQAAAQQFSQFSDTIVDQINDLDEISGYNLNMEDMDKQNLYDFITGTDAAGNNYFAKAMADPKTLVQTAWFALNGQQMIDDISSYFKKEIASVRKESYEKGLADAKKQDGTQVVFKNGKKAPKQDFVDLDDDF